MAEQPLLSNIVSILQKCRKQRNLEYVRHVHGQICNYALEAPRCAGNYIVPAFVDCGSMSDAQQAFNCLAHRTEHSWTSIISGYVDCGQSLHALRLYHKMQEDGVNANSYTLTALLKACARVKDLEGGRQVHNVIREKGLESDTFVTTTLVHMYSKCGSLTEAQEAFDKLSLRQTVSWTTIISGYTEHGSAEEALKCFEKMQLEGVPPDAVTFVCILKACGSTRMLDKGREIHNEIARRGLLKDHFLGNCLVDMYAKCGSLGEAQEVFRTLQVQDVVSWTALISGYVEGELYHEALKCFEEMQLEGVAPNPITFVYSLKCCGSLGLIIKGRRIHAKLLQKLLESDSFVSMALVTMYARCGSLIEAQEVFDRLPVQDAAAWTALIAGYSEHGSGQEVLKCFEKLQLESISPDAATLIYSLKACSSLRSIDTGRKIHKAIAEKGIESELTVGNLLVDMYAKCGSFKEAREVFDKMPVRDVVTWTALISGYGDNGLGPEALSCFQDMKAEGLSPNEVTFVCTLKACASIGDIEKGRALHTELTKRGIEDNDFISSSLVDMYCRCGSILEAREVFDKLPVRDVVSWNAMIAGYAEIGLVQKALQCFEQMKLKGVLPNAATFVSILKVCSFIADVDKGRELQTEITQRGLGTDAILGNALVGMYAKCGSLVEAQEIFDKLNMRDVVSWNAIMAGYIDNGHSHRALSCFEQMEQEGVSPDVVTFVCALKGCASIAAMDKGQEIHMIIRKRGLGTDLLVATTLIDMYTKCGSIRVAEEVFSSLQIRDVIAWNAMIRGYGVNHEGNLAIQCFEDMQNDNVLPDDVTFICLLSACSRASMVGEGKEYFKMMIVTYGISPKVDHYICMVDLLARSGHLLEAQEFLQTASCSQSKELWICLLSACEAYREVEVGFRCFQQLVQMDAEHAASYVLMANISSNLIRWDGVNRIERQVEAKKPSEALIDVHNKLRELMLGDKQSMIDLLIGEQGCYS